MITAARRKITSPFISFSSKDRTATRTIPVNAGFAVRTNATTRPLCRRGGWGVRAVLRTSLISVFAFVMSSTPSIHAESFAFNRGADLRQNVLIMNWPGDTKTSPLPQGSFGITETRGRVWGQTFRGPFTLSGAVETAAQLSSATGGALFAGGGFFGKSEPLERWDATASQIDDASTVLSTRLERFDLRWSAGRWDVDAGRQPVSLGTSRFVGVLDVLAPFSPGNLDATYKPGIDAIRIRRGIGAAGEAELIAAAARDWSGGALLGRFRHQFHGLDLEWIGGRFRRRGFGGVGWEGELAGKGFWGEAAFFQRGDGERRFGGGDAVFSGVTGVDLDLPAKFKVGIAGMYQDSGVRDPEDLPSAYAEAPFTEGWRFLAGAAYGVLTIHRELHPLVQADLAGITNILDSSAIWQPRITISTGDNTDLSFYGWVSAGKRMNTVEAIPVARSEFGHIPDGGGMYARWFF